MVQQAEFVDGVSSASEIDDESVSTTNSSKRSRAKRLVSKAKAKSRDLLQPIINIKIVDDDEDNDEVGEPAFNPGQILEGSPPQIRKPDRDIGSRLKVASNAILHPGRTARGRALKTTAGKFSSGQRPFVATEQDQDLLDAHAELARATSEASSANWDGSDEEGSDIEAARMRVRKLEDRRASLRTAWVIGRHVNRVRAVQRPAARPKREDFIDRDGSQTERFAWERWLAFLILYYTRGTTAHYVDNFTSPPFDMRDLACIVERLAVISSPWQSFIMDLRKIYMWENPKRTCKWAALYWTLWYTEHVIGFAYAYVLYATIRNRYYPSSIESIRQTMEKNLDLESKAQAWGELIEKHGRNDWIEPLIVEMGPVIQMQLGDLTNFLEVLTNFYRWEVPNKTFATLFFFAVCLAITLLSDMRFCVKIVLFIIGGGFFFTWPLGTRYPEYRYIFSAIRWVFWDIPTHAELGIMQLQQKVVLDDAKVTEEFRGRNASWNSSSANSDSEFITPLSSPGAIPIKTRRAHLRFRAYRDRESGHLTISRKGIRFSRKDDTQSIQFSSLIEVRKVDVSSNKDRLRTFLIAMKGLEFTYKADKDHEEQTLALIMRTNDRHKAFSHILAWSGLKWQALQLERQNNAHEDSGKRVDESLKRLMR